MFLPICKDDMIKQNIDQLDFILITGEAYVDHPSFGHAIVSRYVESLGYTVGIIAQPLKKEDYMKLGKPKYAFLITSGVIDSMVNNYSVNKKKRKVDIYSDEKKAGLRPDRAVDVYTKNVKNIYKDSYCIIGGTEASLRRFAHYDYFDDNIRKSILLTSGADLCIYGMGEKVYADIDKLLKRNVPIEKIKNVAGTCYVSDDISNLKDHIELASFEEISKDKKVYAKTHIDILKNNDDIYGKTLVQKDNDKYVVCNKPARPLTTKELDYVYELHYERKPHPSYKDVRSMEEVEFSIVSNRGCFGSCNYCAITFHQGRKLSIRSHESIIREAKLLTELPNFKGYINDVGGPTANFRHVACEKQKKYGVCKERQCLTPDICPNLKVDHMDYLELLTKLRKLDKVKKVFVRSGLRFDYIMKDKNREKFLEEFCKHHVSGQLKVAPEHSDEKVLKLMNKCSFDKYLEFKKLYEKVNEKLNLKQFLVPYLISSHPGTTLKSAIRLSEYLKSISYMPLQVQDFYPTPMSISTTMYYTGLDPYTMESIYIPKTSEDKTMQRALLQYRKKENYNLVKNALIKAGRTDLIGFDKNALIKPLKSEVYKFKEINNKSNSKLNKKIKSKRKER